LVLQDVRNHDDNPIVGGFPSKVKETAMPSWINIVIQLFSNPAIQALIKQIETLFQQKTAAKATTPQGAMAAADHSAALKQAVDEVVAKHVRAAP
jgi:hypothetical protein